MRVAMKQIAVSRPGTALMAMLVWLLAATPLAANIATPSNFTVILDYDSGEVLFEKNADAPMKPASMAKMMTIYLLFREIGEGRLGMDDTLLVSERAYKMGGSRTFLEIDSQVTVADLLRGIIVQSGNDASVVVAEGLAGTEEAFAEEMTRTARTLGMSNTTFGNSTGWPDEATTTTARDLAILSRALIRDYPDLYPMFAEKEFSYNGIRQDNRNPLLFALNGADGLKTGHTEESGYGLAASVVRGDQRMILVLNGLTSTGERRSESIRLINLAFGTWQKHTLMEAGEVLGDVTVNMGVDGTVPVAAAAGVTKVVSRADRDAATKTLRLVAEINAPVEKGQELGEVILKVGDKTESYPVIATRAVEELPIHRKFYAYFYRLIFGHETPLPGAN